MRRLKGNTFLISVFICDKNFSWKSQNKEITTVAVILRVLKFHVNMHNL